MPARTRRARRRAELSWHFLRRGALASSLVSEASIRRTDLVVEIGAGRGALTRELARRCRRLVAVEIDAALCRELRAEFGSSPHVEVVEQDALELSLPEHEDFKVFGNLPFHCTAGILRRLSRAATPPLDAWVIVQREAAERFAGGPYALESAVSLGLKPWFQIEIARRLRRNDFDPPPGVDCVVLWLARRARPLVRAGERKLYEQFVDVAFAGGRATVRDALRGVLTRPQLVRLGRDLRFALDAPPSRLCFDQWLQLFRFVAGNADDRLRRRITSAGRTGRSAPSRSRGRPPG